MMIIKFCFTKCVVMYNRGCKKEFWMASNSDLEMATHGVSQNQFETQRWYVKEQGNIPNSRIRKQSRILKAHNKSKIVQVIECCEKNNVVCSSKFWITKCKLHVFISCAYYRTKEKLAGGS